MLISEVREKERHGFRADVNNMEITRLLSIERDIIGNKVMEYCVNEGSVHWQWECINK